MEVRNAGPSPPLTIVVLAVGACAGALLIAGFERYRSALMNWVRADSGHSAQRTHLVLIVFAFVLTAPLIAMSAYLWSLGGRDSSASRGRWQRGTAVMLGAASVVLGLLLWRFDLLLTAHG